MRKKIVIVCCAFIFLFVGGTISFLHFSEKSSDSKFYRAVWFHLAHQNAMKEARQRSKEQCKKPNFYWKHLRVSIKETAKKYEKCKTEKDEKDSNKRVIECQAKGNNWDTIKYVVFRKLNDKATQEWYEVTDLQDMDLKTITVPSIDNIPVVDLVHTSVPYDLMANNKNYPNKMPLESLDAESFCWDEKFIGVWLVNGHWEFSWNQIPFHSPLKNTYGENGQPYIIEIK